MQGVTPGVLTVYKRPLTVSIGDQVKYQYDPMPALSYAISGFASFDNASMISPYLRLVPPAHDIPGKYPIRLVVDETASILRNYHIITLAVALPSATAHPGRDNFAGSGRITAISARSAKLPDVHSNSNRSLVAHERGGGSQ